MFKLNNVYIFLLIVFLSSCASEKKEQLAEVISSKTDNTSLFNFLLGEWNCKNDDGCYSEKWEWTNGMLLSKGLMRSKDSTDTLYYQSMDLENQGQDWLINYKVHHENGDKEVLFKLIKSENNEYSFQNTFHDYPSLITFNLRNDSTINVTYFGMDKTEEIRNEFELKKIR